MPIHSPPLPLYLCFSVSHNRTLQILPTLILPSVMKNISQTLPFFASSFRDKILPYVASRFSGENIPQTLSCFASPTHA